MNATIPATQQTPKASKTRKPKATLPTPAPVHVGPDLRKQTKVWGWTVLVITVVMSMGLNGYANAENAKEGLAVAAWCMGIAIPVIVLGLSQLAGLLWRLKHTRPAQITGGVACVVLLLSVYHCSTSIMDTTGSPIWLAIPLAVGIDAGLVCSKLAILLAEKE
jgi:hypothetical protein